MEVNQESSTPLEILPMRLALYPMAIVLDCLWRRLAAMQSLYEAIR